MSDRHIAGRLTLRLEKVFKIWLTDNFLLVCTISDYKKKQDKLSKVSMLPFGVAYIVTVQ